MNVRPFTPDGIALLGTDTDKAVAIAPGRNEKTIAFRRRKLGITPFGKTGPGA